MQKGLERNVGETGGKDVIICWLSLLVIFVMIWYMLDMVLLTFVIGFVFYHLLKKTQKALQKLLPFGIPDGIVLLVLYAIFLSLLVILIVDLAPKLVGQFTEIGKMIASFNVRSLRSVLDDRMYHFVLTLDYNSYIEKAGALLAQGITSVSAFGLNFVLSFLLSFLLLLEKGKIALLGEQIKNSRGAGVYRYLEYFGLNFAQSFGKIMRVQVMIATINSVVSMIGLYFMGFPQILALGVMIFCLGLIPVAGVIISLVPLCILAFNIGGIPKVVGVLLMIALIHGLEAYVLNPKLMSQKTNLPVCLVFIILLVSEHYLGAWGLLIGVPLFIFLMDILEVDYSEADPPPKTWLFKKK